jgi:hypothetical protein
MKNLIFTVAIFSLFIACQKDVNSYDCVASKIKQFKIDAKYSSYPFSIRKLKYQDEIIYHFNDNKGSTWLRENCDTVFSCGHNMDCYSPLFSVANTLIWSE